MDNSKFSYIITWGRSGLTLEFGLHSSDGTAYSVERVGGSSQGTLDNIPAGTYQLFARNSGDYSELPALKNPDEFDVGYGATDAINYPLIKLGIHWLCWSIGPCYQVHKLLTHKRHERWFY